jgi:secreted PhoX family phosphatase
MKLSRRNFIFLSGATTTGIVLSASPLKQFYAKAKDGVAPRTKGFGKLVADKHKILDLPPGFQYQIISKTGEKMSDGTLVPANLDGMAAFAGKNGNTILIRNHEVNLGQTPAIVAPKAKQYDTLTGGGTTTLILDSNNKLIKQYVSLAGTSRNCAGGATPWGSWISCEEATYTPADNKALGANPVSRKHGYNFEVFADGELTTPIPLTAMGRFYHEAIAVDPQTGIIYQTEDRDDSCIYRFIPKEKGNLKAGGVLEALAIKGSKTVNTSVNFPQGVAKEVEWIKIEDVDPDGDTVRYEAQAKGAAIFKRGEGTCYANGEIYWTCTSGGNAGLGQIFRYKPSTNTLELYVESKGQDMLDYPDNITFAPFGHIMVCEDGHPDQYLVGINQQGECYHFARNALNDSEFAGICFSPDGKTMFVNIQKPGLTLAITGNWNS